MIYINILYNLVDIIIYIMRKWKARDGVVFEPLRMDSPFLHRIEHATEYPRLWAAISGHPLPGFEVGAL